ncbi:Hypothetical protein MVR_LOCUS25 [uncultured virus]|nr:Hypothetical protein MVR_LOCUS25 [uncultured virus]
MNDQSKIEQLPHQHNTETAALITVAMLDKLPLFVWKIVLPYIYADHRAQFWYEPNQVAPVGISGKDNIYDDDGTIEDDREWATTMPLATALRRTCKHMRDVVLTPAMCEYVLSSYKLGVDSKYIVAVPKPLGFIKTQWDLDIGIRYASHEEVLKQLTPLQWIRALSLDMKALSIDDVLLYVDDYKELGWTIHLTNTTQDLSHFALYQDIELIGMPDTQINMTYTFKSDGTAKSSMCWRNLQVTGLHHSTLPFYFISGRYNHLIIDNCKFDGLPNASVLDVSCRKISVTNCTFTNCNTGIKVKMDASDDDDQGKRVNICDNHFDKCKTAMQLAIDYCLIGHDDLGETACVSGNVVTNVAT